MSRPLIAGLDGSPESRAAAEWAAREAALRAAPLRLLHVHPTVVGSLLGGETEPSWSESVAASEDSAGSWPRMLREAAEGLRLRHPGVEIETEQRIGSPYDVLIRASDEAEMLVLGSRGMGGVGGFLVGSVGLVVVAHVRRPVVLVRAGEQAADEHRPDPAGIPSAATPYLPVLLGLDVDDPSDELLAFAFAEAERRETGLRIVHGWNLPPYYVYGVPADPERYQEIASAQAALLAGLVRPWREKFPDVEVTEESFGGTPSVRLVEASATSSLVIVGRRMRRHAIGTRIGSVTHAVLHHATAPVAVIPYH
ncbi:universal stress protein [Streptomyces sp. SBST2-5]|uniref:Universal stress protein n=1 Tax=Streptomyces composti TaxID=2720025 RepID=A0ABX1A6V6_9ACTN|nr:universal stress protein [Streptomyces composti]NJP52190.1 universal stress protein [Streptomyces composti]